MAIAAARSNRALSFLLSFLLIVAPLPAAFAASPVAMPDGSPDAITSLYGSEAEEMFGNSIAIDGDLVAVGTPGASSLEGEVLIYRRTSSGLEHEATVIAPDRATNGASAQFGLAVDVSGDVLLVGAPGANGGDGKFYFFRESGSVWSLETSVPGLPGREGQAGTAVAIDGIHAIIGEPGTNGNAGYVRMMQDSGAGWVQSGGFFGTSGERAGASVAISGIYAVAGSPRYLNTYGRARVYRYSGAWLTGAYATGSSGDYLGTAVGTDGTSIVVSAPRDDVGAVDTGQIRVYTTGMSARMAIVSDDAASYGLFGNSLDLKDGMLVVSEPGHASTAGRINIYSGSLSSWAKVASFVEPNAASGEYFATDIAIQNGVIFASDADDSSMAADGGAVYEYSLGWYTTTEETTLTVAAPGVLGNDYDLDADPLEAYLVTGTSGGTITVSPNGGFTYIPDVDFDGWDSFTYRTYDGSTYSSPTVASIFVQNVNDAPRFVQSSPTTVTCSEDGSPVPFTLTLDVADPDSADEILWGIRTAPSHGVASVSGTGLTKTIQYTPAANYYGTDSFEIRVNDLARVYDYMIVDVIIDPVNDAPTFNLRTPCNVSEDAAPVTLANWATGISPGGWMETTQTLVANTASDHPELFTVQPSISVTGTLSFEAAPNAYGSATVWYGITDVPGTPESLTTTKTMTINIAPVNDAPVSNPDAYTTQEDQPVMVGPAGILGNDTDTEGPTDTPYWGPLEASLFTDVSNGALFFFANGSFLYSPEEGWSGTDEFAYRAWDGNLFSEPTTVTIEVGGVNDEPVIDQGGTVAAVVAEDGVVDMTLTATDADGDPLAWSVVTLPHDGAASVASADTTGMITYTPDPDYNGSDAFTVQASDGNGGTDLIVIEVSVTPVNDAPIAMSDAYMLEEETLLEVDAPGLLSNDIDIDGDALTCVLESGPTHGSLTLAADGAFTYTPESGWSGLDAFSYRAADADEVSEPVSVTLTVRSVDTTYTAVEGADRFLTSAAAAQMAFPGTADTVVIATAYNWPDALAGSGLAGAVNGPILLTRSDELPAETLSEIDRLEATKAYVLGGETAASADVHDALVTKLGADNVIRIGGADRYETAALVAEETIAQLGTAWDGRALIATGRDFPDAIAASPLSAATGWPVFLVRESGVTTGIASDLGSTGVTHAIVLGGSASVPADAEAVLAAEGIGSERLSGHDRYSTSVAIAAYGAAHAGLSWNVLGFATGEDFPDALAGGITCASRAGVMVLNPSEAMNESVRGALTDHRSEISEVLYFGGTAAVSQEVRDTVRNILR